MTGPYEPRPTVPAHDRRGRGSSVRPVDALPRPRDDGGNCHDQTSGAAVTSSHRPVATLATVAAVAGVSRQTVSNALNNPELLRPDTLARVQEAIDRLGYRPNRAARNLRTRTSHLIGLRIEPT